MDLAEVIKVEVINLAEEEVKETVELMEEVEEGIIRIVELVELMEEAEVVEVHIIQVLEGVELMEEMVETTILEQKMERILWEINLFLQSVGDMEEVEDIAEAEEDMVVMVEVDTTLIMVLEVLVEVEDMVDLVVMALDI